MTIRILQWGAGINGAALIRAIVKHASTELVGCRVWSADKNGVDAGELAGIGPVGVLASNDREAMLKLDADVAIVCPLLTPDLTENDRDIVDLLRSGKNVIDVSGARSFPWGIPGYAKQFEDACLEGGSTFAAGGINPGFMAERLAPTLTGLCTDVSKVEMAESYDCSVCNPGVFYETMGFARPLEEWKSDSPSAQLFNHLFSQCVHAMAHAMGVRLKEVRHSATVAPAPHDLEVHAGRVPKGTVAAICQSWTGIPEDPSDITLVKSTNWICGTEIPDHPVYSGWRITVTGTPTFVCDVRNVTGGDLPDQNVGGGITLIPDVMAAPPGIFVPKIAGAFRKHFD